MTVNTQFRLRVFLLFGCKQVKLDPGFTFRFDMTVIRYAKISEILTRRIADQQYPVGGPMPTEKALAEEFGVSRHTIRAAMRQLQDLRLISRRRGSGTIVEAMAPNSGFSQSLSSLDDLVNLAARTPRQLQKIRHIVADTELARDLGITPGTKWTKISSTRNGDDGKPIVWTDVYVDARLSGMSKRVKDNPDRLISELIETYHGRRIVTVEQAISACDLPSFAAKVFDAAPGSPGLFILRQYRDQGGAMLEVSASFHPASRYKFLSVLVRA